jgi:small subunit ribosomal protein S8
MTDPIADLLTRIRNAARAGHKKLALPSSRMKREIARLLAENNYLRSYAEVAASPQNRLVIRLRYTPQHDSVITGLERVSRPGLRRYGSAEDVRAMQRKLGITIVSTSRGIMTGREAAEQGIGGEILCRVW